MSLPQLYRQYTRESAIALFGSAGVGRESHTGQWVTFPGVTLCFTTLCDSKSDLSAFDTGSRFRWGTDISFGRDKYGLPLIPEEVRGNYKPKPEIWLLARWGSAADFTCLGNLDQSYSGGTPRTGPAYVNFSLTPALPWRLFAEINGLDPAVRDFQPVAAALERLNGPATAHDRFEVLQTLVEYWSGPVNEGDGYSEEELAGIAMPDVLRWWYRWAGKRVEIMSGQNDLFSGQRPHRGLDWLSVEDSLLMFYVENQWCNLWAVPVDGEDPIVYERENEDQPWQEGKVRLSEHLIISCLFEAAFECPYGACAVVYEEVFEEISKVVRPIAVPPWLWLDTRIHCSNGITMIVSGGDGGYSLWLGSLTEEPVQFLRSIDEQWDYISI